MQSGFTNVWARVSVGLPCLAISLDLLFMIHLTHPRPFAAILLHLISNNIHIKAVAEFEDLCFEFGIELEEAVGVGLFPGDLLSPSPLPIHEH